MVSSVRSRGVRDRSGALVGAIVVVQYNPKLTVLLKKRTTSQILAGAVMGAKAFAPGKATVTSRVISGNQVRLIRTASASVAITYKTGGKLVQIFGSSSATVLRVASAYLEADHQ